MIATETLQEAIEAALREMGVAEAGEVALERPRNSEHGDLATNVAMVHAKSLQRPPRQIAEELIGRLDLNAAGLSSAEVAGPGFINFRFAGDLLHQGLIRILDEDDSFGHGATGAGEKVMVEFVSANPTGPLHPGHGRQAALGDAIAELLSWNGFAVTREYYYNDAGEQINRLVRSVWARYQQAGGRDVAFPDDGYHGEYITELAASLREAEGERLDGETDDAAFEIIRHFAVGHLMAEIENDLADFRVRFDSFYRESSLYDDGRVDQTVSVLGEAGLTYEDGGALWLRTTRFGDDKDRVMLKSTGAPTYFLPDVAYHGTKWERGFRRAINVQGADHHGTIARVRAGVQALGIPAGYPDYVLHQMVTVMRGSEEEKFSKRAGGYVTLRDLFTEVGVDVARYFFLMRRAEAQLVFDIDLALDQSDKNPVYKIQYAHARMCSIFAKAKVAAGLIDAAQAPLEQLRHPSESELLKVLLRFPETVAAAAAQHAPHAVCTYLEELAGSVNSWYHAGNLDPELRVVGVAADLSRARLVLSRAVQIVLRNGLALLGIAAPERMERQSEPTTP